MEYFTLDGGMVLGASVEDEIVETSRAESERLARSMMDQFGAARAWVVYEDPAPDDPIGEQPWRDAIFSISSAR